MPMVRMAEYDNAGPEVKAVYDDIMATRKSNWVNNFWKTLASHPPTLRRIWIGVKEVMSPGKLDPLTKEMIYVAVSATNNCEYCIHSHIASARAKGMPTKCWASCWRSPAWPTRPTGSPTVIRFRSTRSSNRPAKNP